MDWLAARLKEPSTHAALTAVAAALTPLIPPPFGLFAVAIFGLLGVGLSEKSA